MSRSFILFLFLSSTLNAAWAQESKDVKPAMSCCAMGAGLGTTATASFARFANENNFIMAHESPIPFTYIGEGKMISFSTPDGKTANGFEIKAAKKTDNWIFVIHEWWGLNDYIKKESDRLSNELNVNVLALDLYDGKVATKPEDAGNYMKAATQDRCENIIKGALGYVGTKANIGTIGWCFGGGWSLQATLLIGKQAKACVMYYGMPEKDLTKLKTLNTDVLGIFGDKDAWITPEVVKEFEGNMKKADKKVAVHSYHADHAFANPSNPKYDKVNAEAAWKETTAYFKAHFKS